MSGRITTIRTKTVNRAPTPVLGETPALAEDLGLKDLPRDKPRGFEPGPNGGAPGEMAGAGASASVAAGEMAGIGASASVAAGGLSMTASARDDGMTIRTMLRRGKGVSARLMRKAIHGTGELYRNGAPARFLDQVRAGDEIRLVFPEETSLFAPQDIPVSVLYEDEDILVLDKQPGVVVHPTKGHADGTLANGIMRHMAERGERYKIRFANRLDMGTSGVLLCGKNAHTQADFARQAAEGTVRKIYRAIVWGALAGSGRVDAPIALEQEGAPRRAVKPEAAGGKPSVTEWESERVFSVGGRPCTLLRLRLLTGRTHQIRVHLAHIGHPVLGDALYGGADAYADGLCGQGGMGAGADGLGVDMDGLDGAGAVADGMNIAAAPVISRQALHAAELCFLHPQDARPLRFEAPLPTDMAFVLR